MSIESVMPSNHLILCCPLLLLPSIFPSIRIFSNEPVLCIRWPKYWSSASALVLPMNIQDWFPLGLTGWISLQSKGRSRVFSNTTVQKHQFFYELSKPEVVNYWTWRGKLWEHLNWIVSWAEVPVTYGPHLRLASEVSTILWDWACNQENPGWHWVVSVRTESNCGTPSCCQRIRKMVGVGKDTTYLMEKNHIELWWGLNNLWYTVSD